MARNDTEFTEGDPRRVSGLWLIINDEGAVLVVQPSYRPAKHYQLVGGCAHAGEAPPPGGDP